MILGVGRGAPSHDVLHVPAPNSTVEGLPVVVEHIEPAKPTESVELGKDYGRLK